MKLKGAGQTSPAFLLAFSVIPTLSLLKRLIHIAAGTE
jgi:hypothetical protein